MFYLPDSLDALVIVPDEHRGPLVLHVVPHLLVGRDLGVPEECHCAPAAESSVGNLLLSGKILGVLYRSDHLVYREEGRQVGGVGRDDDQCEEPPDGAHYPRACGLGIQSRSL